MRVFHELRRRNYGSQEDPLIVSALVVVGSATTAMADFQGISVTATSHAWGVSYQIFVDVDAGDQLNAVYGDAVNALSVDGTGAFYQNAFGGTGSTKPRVNCSIS